MIGDQQTHQLPEQVLDQERVAKAMHCFHWSELCAQIRLCEQVRQLFFRFGRILNSNRTQWWIFAYEHL